MEEIISRVEQILDELVRPHLKAHQGNIEVLEMGADGVLKVRLLGQCSHCPAAAITNEEMIEGQLCERLPEIKRVVLVNGVSEELLDQARRLLRKDS